MNRAQQRDRKASQLQRIRSAMLEIAAAEGYAEASIARVIARAGVSRPTFYDYFAGREECMLVVIEGARGELTERATQAVKATPGRDAMAGVIDALVGFAQQQPAMARVLYGEAMAAGPRALRSRDRAVAELEALVEGAYAPLKATISIPDVPAPIMIGAVFRLLAQRLRRRETELGETRAALLDWIWAYKHAKREHRWRVLGAGKAAVTASGTGGTAQPLVAICDTSTGARGSSGAPAAQERRRRVLLSLAELCSEKGYAAVSVQDMTRRADVEMRTFYRMFAGKQEAFAALAEVYFQHMMALTAGAFFSDRAWPERVLCAKLAFAGCVEANPAVARACFIEAHAADRDGGERVEQLTRAFTLFLTEGTQLCSRPAGVSRLGQEAIAHANFELVYRQARASATPRMAGVVGHSVHLCLAPFIGVAPAAELIERGLAQDVELAERPGRRAISRSARHTRQLPAKRRVGEPS